MSGVVSFLDSILHCINLVALALTVGSVFWGMLVLQAWKNQKILNRSLVSICLQLLYKSALILAIVQTFIIVAKAWLITDTLGQWPFPAFTDTIQFQAGSLRVFLALVIAGFVYFQLSKFPYSNRRWLILFILMIFLVLCGAWLVHGAGRLDNRLLLMSFTVIHQVAASIWVAGIAQLIIIWILNRHSESFAPEWVVLLSRFSRFGIYSVVVLTITGLSMAWFYVGSIAGLVGTGYGNLLMVKLTLLVMVLGFAALNYTAVNNWRRSNNTQECSRHVPSYIECEAFILIAILFSAAALSSQPPSVDVADLTASLSEVVNTISPKFPRLISPSHQQLIAGEAGRTAILNQTPSAAAAAWSDYNHNISGVFLFVMSLFGMLAYRRSFNWANHWPLGFVGLAIFLFFRSDAEAWPMGTLGFWESFFGNVEILQHRLATLLAFALGVFEYRARKPVNSGTWLPYMFPILCAMGGLLLMTHSHIGFQAKTEFLIQIGHTLIGLLAIVIACGRWLELRLEPPVGRVAGFISIAALFLVSLVLMFYREPV